jgi:sterol desaturase/sphingolipid hydroxylase (fatty acid hydroxylase superfamily)
MENPDLGRIAYEVAFTVLLTGALVFGALRLVPAITHEPPRSLDTVLISVLMPVCALVLLSLLERALPPAGPRKSLLQWLVHLQINIFWSLVAGFLFALAAIGAASIARRLGFSPGLIDLRFAGGRGIPALLAAVWVSAVVGDFFFYWYHRILHRFHLLWQIHKMHHMDENLDVLTVFRDNWLDTLGSSLFSAFPLALLFRLDDLDPGDLGLLAGAGATALSTLLTIGHMNVRLQVGRLSMLFCSPQLHRIHHSRLAHHFDRNFAVVLPLWDVLFGTYYAPAPDEFPPTGVPGETDFQSFWEAETFTLRQWWRMLRARRSRWGRRSATSV